MRTRWATLRRLQRTGRRMSANSAAQSGRPSLEAALALGTFKDKTKGNPTAWTAELGELLGEFLTAESFCANSAAATACSKAGLHRPTKIWVSAPLPPYQRRAPYARPRAVRVTARA